MCHFTIAMPPQSMQRSAVSTFLKRNNWPGWRVGIPAFSIVWAWFFHICISSWWLFSHNLLKRWFFLLRIHLFLPVLLLDSSLSHEVDGTSSKTGCNQNQRNREGNRDDR